MLKAIIFDLDDTLFDHRSCSRNALNRVRERYPFFRNTTLDEMEKTHLQLLNEIHLSYVLSNKMTLDEARTARFNLMLKYTGNETNDELAKEIAIFYNEWYEKDEWNSVPGAYELLQTLKEKYKIGIISNNFTKHQIIKLERCGLTELIDEVVTSEEAGYTKPDKRIFYLMLSRLNLSAHEAIMIGDSWEVDITGALNAGIKSIWFNRFNLPSPNPAMSREINSFIPPENVIKIIEEIN